MAELIVQTDPIAKTTRVTFVVTISERNAAQRDELYRAMEQQFSEGMTPADAALLLERCLRLSEKTSS